MERPDFLVRAEFQSAPCRGETGDSAKQGLNCTHGDFMRAMKYATHWHNTSVAKGGEVGRQRERDERHSFRVMSEISSTAI